VTVAGRLTLEDAGAHDRPAGEALLVTVTIPENNPSALMLTEINPEPEDWNDWKAGVTLKL
jgi:hypothetical protein